MTKTLWLPDYSIDRAPGILAAKGYLAKRRGRKAHPHPLVEFVFAVVASAAVVTCVFAAGLYLWAAP